MSNNYFAVVQILLLLSLTISEIRVSDAQSPHAPLQETQADRLVVDLSTSTGPVLHGATGWLYGQSAPGIPTVNIMEPLHPQITAQKPAGGLQHPMGDASLVAPDLRAAGGTLMQIYMQDIYPDWPYNDMGIDEYLLKVDAMTRQIVADPNHDLFVYVPFNEPNNNWYADNGPKFSKFLHDWTLVYRKIRSIDPGAKIAGPGFEHFNRAAFETFLRFARDSQVLPDEFTWHELHDDFFSQWYRRVDEYRASEAKLGIPSLPIVINEYARDRGDLAVPGNLVQWVARLENSKVYGCLAFWTPAGTLSDLTARIWPNRPTGAWWLYRWYGGMTGNTVKVTPPDPDAVGLQGIAALDASRQQVRMIFGGTAKAIRLELHGLEQVPWFGGGVHVSLSRIPSSGVEPSPGPETIAETNQTLTHHELALSVPAAGADIAYSLILTPAVAATGEPDEHNLLAVDADFAGRAVYSEPRGSAVVLGSSGHSKDESVRFIAQAAKDGYASLGLRYSASKKADMQLIVDDEPARMLKLGPSADRDVHTLRLFLAAGVHRFRFSLVDAHASVSLHSLRVESTTGDVVRYETSSSENKRGATAQTLRQPEPEQPEPGAQPAQSGIGKGSASFLEFKRVKAQGAGDYAMVITYANGETGHKGQVDERTEITVNGGQPVSIWLRNTFSDKVFATSVARVHLNAGDNRVRFANPAGRAPIIESIQIASEDE